MGYSFPAQIANIKGLQRHLLNRGFQPLTDRPLDIGGASTFPLTTIKSGAVKGYTVRYKHIALFAATHVSAIFGNHTADNSLSETPGRNHVRYKLRFQKNGAGGGSTGWNDMSPPRVPALFGGSEWADVAPGTLVAADPLAFEVATGEVFFVWVTVDIAGTSMYLPGGLGTMGGTGNSSLGCCDNGDALAVEDVIASGTVTVEAQTNRTGAIAILGASPVTQKTVGVVGDSLANGATDAGAWASRGGYLERMMMGLTNNVNLSAAVEAARVPNFPFVKCTRAGNTLANFVNRANNSNEIRLLSMCSTVVSEYGLNDLSTTNLAAMQALYLQLAKYFTDRGAKFIQCTLTPRTTSTNFWLDVAGQTPVGGVVETTRTGLNSWFRDASGSGFIAQANAPGLVDIWDVAATFEVNSSGVLTPNGGYFPAAWSTNNATGTLTAIAGTTYTDAALTTTLDQWRGYHIRMTSGAATNGTKEINAVWTGGRFILPTAITSPGSPSIGDAYAINEHATLDGTHLGSRTNLVVCQGLIAAGALQTII